MSKGFEQNLQKASLVLKDAFERIEKASEGTVLDENTSKALYSQLNGLGKLVKNIAIQFGTMRLPEDLSKQVNELQQKISEVQSKITNATNKLMSARTWTAKNQTTGEMMLSKKARASIFRNNIMPGETKPGQVHIDGQLFTSYKALTDAAANGTQELKDKVSEVFTYISTLKNPQGVPYLNTYLEDIQKLKNEIENLQKELKQLNEQSEKATTSKGSEFVDVNEVLGKVNSGIDNLTNSEKEAETQTEQLDDVEIKNTQTLDKKQKTLMGTAAKTVLYHNAVNMLKRMLRTTINVVQDLDKAFTDMAVVTTMSREQT